LEHVTFPGFFLCSSKIKINWIAWEDIFSFTRQKTKLATLTWKIFRSEVIFFPSIFLNQFLNSVETISNLSIIFKTFFRSTVSNWFPDNKTLFQDKSYCSAQTLFLNKFSVHVKAFPSMLFSHTKHFVLKRSLPFNEAKFITFCWKVLRISHFIGWG